MRPFALTMVSALIFSPSIVLSTIYHPEHQIHTTHNSDPSLTSISVEIVVPLKSSAKFNECKYTPYKCSAVDTDKYGLECQNNFIDNSQIRQSAKTACHQISEHHGHGLSNYIPRTAYQRQGPYFEYSVEDDSKKWGGEF